MSPSFEKRKKNANQASRLLESEPCIFPAFDKGESNGADILCLRGKLCLPEELECYTTKSPAEINNTLLAAWGVLLSCYTGLEEVCFAVENSASGIANESTSGVGIAQLRISDDRSVKETILATQESSIVPLLHHRESLFNTYFCIGTDKYGVCQGGASHHDLEGFENSDVVQV
jgi:hypothetical protein